MEIEKIKKVADGWQNATWQVIDFKNPGFDVVRALFTETYVIIEKYSKEKLIPKELSGLIFEMHDFSWWVGNLKDTPLHFLYQEICHLVVYLNKYLLSGDADIQDIKNTIEKINENNFFKNMLQQ